MFPRTRILAWCAVAIGLGLLVPIRTPAADAVRPLRPPAVPLVACDPYFCIWSVR